MRQPLDRHRDLSHGPAPGRAGRRSAPPAGAPRASLSSSGQASAGAVAGQQQDPVARRRRTRRVPGETSLARIQSQPLRASLARALASRSPVSAAKPITSRGPVRGVRRACAGCPGSPPARSRAAASPVALLDLARRHPRRPPVGDRGGADGDVRRQRAPRPPPASRARSRHARTVTPGGSGSCTGPLTRVTAAPASASAAAMAWPCRPEEWLDR